MTARLTLYTRANCCLCEEMKSIVREVAGKIALALEEIDVDSAAELQEKYGHEVPVLMINGRKAFKYRATARELSRKLGALRDP